MSFGMAVSKILTRNLLQGLMNRQYGALRIEDFLSPDRCTDLLAEDMNAQFERYDPIRYASEAYRIGPTLNEHRVAHGVSDEYWEHAAAAHAFWSAEARCFVPHTWIAAKLSGFLGMAVRPATIRGKDMYWGIIREMNKGTLTHWDDISIEFSKGPFDFPAGSQLALNIFAAAPESGGSLTVWDQGWRSADEKYRMGFGYASEVIRSDTHVSVKPAVGDAIIFDPRNYHAVTPVTTGRRLSFSTFLGLSDKTLWLWS
ncbi:2OG-Fe(II) oxygenase [Streptomyces sp. NPDC094149]|uniref:2OG-Fe(II) oxygenase n=1 Tax=Streptomyces sp. NPDC094149 TaxID=3155079 RepID=UPI00331A56B1